MQKKLHKNRFFRHLVADILMIAIFPFLVLFDLFVEIYHRIAFRMCKIQLVKRREYIRIDRQKLSYLNWHEKIGCMYCGYANGFAKYLVEICARTECYWCGIKHEKMKGVKGQAHQKDFLEYGDEKSFRKLQ